MSETRSTRKRGMAKARATATSPEPISKASAKEASTVTPAPSVASQTKAKSGGKKQPKKAAAAAATSIPPPAPASPSPTKKKKRRRLHKRKNSGVEVDVNVDAGEAMPSEEVAQQEPPTPNTKKTKQTTSGKTTPVKKNTKKVEEAGPAPPPTPKAAPAATGKRKSRTGSISHAQEEEMTVKATAAEGRQVSVVSKKKSAKQATVEKAPKGRTTRAALAAAAAAAAAGDSEDVKAVAASDPQETVSAPKSKAKKKRKTKAARSVLTESLPEPTPEPDIKARDPPPTLVRKSPRLVNDDATEAKSEQLISVKPVRKIVSLAKVKGKASRTDTVTATATEKDDEPEVATEKPLTDPSAYAVEEATEVDAETEGLPEALEDVEKPTDAGVVPFSTEVKEEEKSPSVDEMEGVEESTEVGLESDLMKEDEKDDEDEEGEAPVQPKLEVLLPGQTSEIEKLAEEERGSNTTEVDVEMEALSGAMQDVEEPAGVDLIQFSTEVEEEEMAADEEPGVGESTGIAMESKWTEDDEEGEEDDARDEPLEADVGGQTSSVESIPDDGSYQAAVLDQALASPLTSEREDGVSMEEVTEAQSIVADEEEELEETEDVPVDDDALSEGSIDGTEAFTLEVDEEDDDPEYESLGVSSTLVDREREAVVDRDDHGDQDGTDSNDGASTLSTTNSTSLQVLRDAPYSQEHRADNDNREEEERFDSFSDEVPVHGGLNDSFVVEEEESGDMTDSDDEAVLASQPETAIIDELPGLRSSSSNYPTAENEVIVLSDTDSDEDAESTSHSSAVNDDKEGTMDPDDEEDDEAAVERFQSEGGHVEPEEMSDEEALTSTIGETRSDSIAAIDSTQDGEEIALDRREEDDNVDNIDSENELEQNDEEPEDLSDEEAQMPFSGEGAAEESQDEADENQHEEHMAADPMMPDQDLQSSGNESDRTIELDDVDDETHEHDAPVQLDEIAEERGEDAVDDKEERQNDSGDVQVQRTLLTAPEAVQWTPSVLPALAEVVSESDQFLLDNGCPTRDTQVTSLATAGTDTEPAKSSAGTITYTTTPSKHLIDSVLSSSREQTLASITNATISTPSQPPKSSTKQTWGLSFGVSESLDAISTTANVANQAVASPLSSWFFSRGPANFKKRVLIPTPGSPRQRVGSPRPLKKMRVEAVTPRGTSLSDRSDQSESGTDRFVQSLVDHTAWRSWYTSTTPDQLLDPPLPVEMVKRLGGDAALALLSHPSMRISSPVLEPMRDPVAVPKKRRRALAQLEASIQEEKKQTKAFDEELLQLLQGKTLSGRDLTEEFAPLLPPASQR